MCRVTQGESKINKSISSVHIKEVTERIEAALELLRKEKGMPVLRARAIAKTASSIIDTVKLEAHKSPINRGKQ